METTTPLIYPEEFRVTSLITRINVLKLMQDFVDNITFYTFYVGRKVEITKCVSLKDDDGNIHDFVLRIKKLSWAERKREFLVDVVLNCMETNELKFKEEMDLQRRQLHAKYTKHLDELVSKEYLDDDRKKRTKLYMKEWESEQAPLVTYPSEITLEKNEKISLPFEFNLVCDICSLKPEQVLSHFMGQISISGIKAYMQFKEKNPASASAAHPMSLEAKACRSVNDTDAQKQVRSDYEKKFLVVHASLNRELDMERREATYKAFYKEWYEELIKVS